FVVVFDLVAACEDAGYRRVDHMLGFQHLVLIEIELVFHRFEEGAVGIVAVADEDVIDCHLAAVIEHDVFYAVACLVRCQMIDASVELYVDVAAVEFLCHRFVSAHGVAPAYHRDARGNIGNLGCPVDGGIAAARNEHMPVLEAGETFDRIVKVGDFEFIRTLDFETCRGENAPAGCDDDGFAVKDTVIRDNLEMVLMFCDCFTCCGNGNAGIERLSLFNHVVLYVLSRGGRNAADVPDDLFRIYIEFAAKLRMMFNDLDTHAAEAGVEACIKACGTAADDQRIRNFHAPSSFLLKLGGFSFII